VAVASLLAERYRDNIESLKLSQPGGIIEVSVRWEGKVVEARISGDVTIEAEGAIDLDI
jgi:diaminopimelate epimerase